MKTSPPPFLILISLLLACASARSGDWPQWRGPHFNGSADDRDLPVSWTKADALWNASLPGPGAATPVIRGDLVFMTAPDPVTSTLHALCFDRKDGHLLWDRQVTEGKINGDERSNFATPSPVADAGRVIFGFGNGLLVGFDNAGNQLWSRDLVKDYGPFALNWTYSSSPALYDGKLFVEVLQRDVPTRGHGGTNDSYILALDPATGTNLWRMIRPTDAPLESHEAYTTPIPFLHDGKMEIVVCGGDYLTGYDPADGREIWRSSSLNPSKNGMRRVIATPVAAGDVFLFCVPQPNQPSFAIKAGNLPASSAIIWRSGEHKEISADIPSPLLYDGDFFVQSDGRKTLTRVDPATGGEKWSIPLPGTSNYEASPTGADDKLYLLNWAGDVFVVNAANGAILGTNSMGDAGDDKTRSTIAVADGALFIRTNHKLWCVTKK